MKVKKKKEIFVCEITDTVLKVLKCRLDNSSQREIIALEVETFTADTDDSQLSGKLISLFRKLGYNQQPLILSLPRNKVTCRSLKVPTDTPQEIEKIISLQASRYLPYPNEELITGYEVLSKDKQGYSQINLAIAHKDIVDRYLKLIKELKPVSLNIILSSYGLVNLYNFLNPDSLEPVIILDIDGREAELVVVCASKLFFSRSFKIDASLGTRGDLLAAEINKSREAYFKEFNQEAPAKILVIDSTKLTEELPYDKINIPANLLNKLPVIADVSFAKIVGFGLKDISESLNLLPPEIKEKKRLTSQRKEYLKLISIISGIILLFGLSFAKNLDNKTRYLAKLKQEMNKLSKEAADLDKIEKRLMFIAQRQEKKISPLDLLYELHKVMPPTISLVNLTYEETGQITLRGQAQELNSVFLFTASLEKSPAFKNFNIKVRYATQKKTQSGQVVDFEITCIKK